VRHAKSSMRLGSQAAALKSCSGVYGAEIAREARSGAHGTRRGEIDLSAAELSDRRSVGQFRTHAART